MHALEHIATRFIIGIMGSADMLPYVGVFITLIYTVRYVFSYHTLVSLWLGSYSLLMTRHMVLD
jgi:hypothetical protein